MEIKTCKPKEIEREKERQNEPVQMKQLTASEELAAFFKKHEKQIMACGLDISFNQIINRLFSFEKRPK
jgi:hypothetical protein